MLRKMTDREPTEEETQAYLDALQVEVMKIVNQVKEEMGVDTPIDIEVREASDDE